MNKTDIVKQQSDFILYTGNDGKVNIDVFVQDENIKKDVPLNVRRALGRHKRKFIAPPYEISIFIKSTILTVF